MAGKPGMKGGGGARPGAGRKPQPKEEKLTIASNGTQTPLEFLLSVMNDNEVEDKLRLDAAKTAAQYCHPKKGEGGIKEEKQELAKRAGSGRFGASTAPPRLVSNRGA
jgi:phage terminase small subunit